MQLSKEQTKPNRKPRPPEWNHDPLRSCNPPTAASEGRKLTGGASDCQAVLCVGEGLLSRVAEAVNPQL